MVKQLTLVLFLCSVPAIALAQDAAASASPGDRVQFVEETIAASGPGFDVAASLQVQQVPPPPAPPASTAPPPTLPRRRGSMVGYIEDATVGSQVRLRYDLGFHMHVPDRAEFFYAKCGCYRDIPAGNPLSDPNAPGPGPGVVTDLNFQQVYLQAEYSGGSRVSIFGEAPIRWIQPQLFATPQTFPDQSGFGDLQGGLKIGIVNSDLQTATLQVKGYFPTGDAAKGLGTNHTSIEPSLLLNNGINDRAAIESEVGFWHPIGGSAKLPNAQGSNFSGDIFYWGIGPSVDVYRDRSVRVAPVVELVGWHILNGSQTIQPGTALDDASGTNIVNLKIGGRVSLANGSSVYAGWGKALTEATWYDSIFRFEFRFGF
jgi:hypothetical protein